jgi:oligopeptide/dipeptide ABC transporter ATP-binding protein
MSPILDVRHLGVSVGQDGKQDKPVTIVDDVSFTINRGEVLGLAGESGSGKTMTALALMGILPPHTQTSGTALFNGQDDLLALRGNALRKVQGRRVAMVFQDPAASLHPMLTVGKQLTEHMRHHLGLSKREAREKAADLLDQVRIPNPRAALGSFPHQFSGGMRQRIQIASALACDPELLIADEPTTALDVTIQAGILGLLDLLCAERGLAVLLITHDLGILAAIAGRVLVMYSGRVIELAETGELVAGSRHPYTRALLSSVPHPGSGETALVPIAGTPPAPAARPPGCAFAPRCKFAEQACTVEVPPLTLVGQGHESACRVDPFLAGDRR